MKKKFKRAVACIMAVCLLIVAVPPVQTQAAGFISPGMLFSFMASLCGSYVHDSFADSEAKYFAESWLSKKVSDVEDKYFLTKQMIDSLKAGDMTKFMFTSSLFLVYKEYFQERTADYGGISSGTATSIYEGKAYIGKNYKNNSSNISFRNYFKNSSYYTSPTIFVSADDGYFYAYKYSSGFVDFQYFFVYGLDTKSVYNKVYNSDGSRKSSGTSCTRYVFNYNPLTGLFSYDRKESLNVFPKDLFDFAFTEFPVRYSETSVSDSNLNTFLINTIPLNVTDVNQIYTVTGGYNAGTIDKLADKELSAIQLQAIQDAVRTAVLDNTTTAEDDDTLVYAPDISIDLANAIVQTLVDQGVITDETTGDDTTTTDPPLVVPTDPATFGIDLTKLFPFCIPFDLYDMLNVLCAEPTAPSFNWEIMSPTGKKEKFTIDLSVFDSVAQVVRTVELLGFCVGLAFKTRDLIRG